MNKRPNVTFIFSLLIFLLMGKIPVYPSYMQRKAQRTIRHASRLRTSRKKYARRSRRNRHYWKLGSRSLRTARKRYRKRKYRLAYIKARSASHYFRSIRTTGSRKLQDNAGRWLSRAKKLLIRKNIFLIRMHKRWKKSRRGRRKYFRNRRRIKHASLSITRARRRYRKKLFTASIVASKNAISKLNSIH